MRDRWLKRLGLGVLSVVLLVGVAGAGLYGFTATSLRESYDVKVAKVVVPADAEAVARGARFSGVIAKCVDCHGANLQGKVLVRRRQGCRGATGRSMAGEPDTCSKTRPMDGAGFFRALREGKRPDGSVIDPFMPWALTAQMSDDEIRALWFYLKTVPAIGGIVHKPADS